MCDVAEVKNGWEVTCNNSKRLITYDTGIMIDGCTMSYVSVDNDCPKLPSGVHVAFEKERNGTMAKVRLETEYCQKCAFRERLQIAASTDTLPAVSAG